VKVELKEGQGLVRELSIELPAETVNDRMEKAFADIRRKVTLKGFRKGKAPMKVIKSNYGAQVRADVAEELIKTSYTQAVQERTLKVASPPTVTDLDFPEGGGFKYTAQVEILPEIPTVDYKGLELASEEVEVADSEVDDYAEYLRKQLAEYRTVERAATADDTLVVDLEKTLDPSLVLKEDKFTDAEVDLSSATTVKEFKEQLPGMKAGDEKEIEVKYDDDYSDAAFAGARIKYRCRVKAVKERLLPEWNDALARRIGKAETALELRLKLRDEIRRQKEDARNRGFKNQIIEQVCRLNTIPVPESMVNHYVEHILEDLKKSNESVDETAMRSSYRQLGTNTIRWNMLMHRLAELEGIEVSREDTEILIKKFADNYQTTFEQAREALTRSGKVADIRESQLEEKVLDFLVGKAKMVKGNKKE